jgi:uncharacterized protein (DUF1330 family)
MSAYLIANVEVHDPEAYEDYRSRTGATSRAMAGASSSAAARSMCWKETPASTAWS